MRVLLFAFLGSLVVVGCTKAPRFQDPAFAPAAAIDSSFKVINSETATPAPDLQTDHDQISIQRSALEKEFLLQVEMIPQAMAPRFSALESRIVSFHQQDGQLYLLETSKGHNLAANMPQTILLAQFPILSEDVSAIVFDFNKGMSSIFVGGDWRSGDHGPNLPDAGMLALKTSFSYIENAAFTSNHLMISQVAHVETTQPDSAYLGAQTIKVLYYLSPYLENAGFKPTVAPANMDRVGYFEIASLVNDQSGTVTYASKRDLSKPIVYAISANTPDEYKQAVKDGILYWNRALGKDLITVIEAPKGVTAPSMDYDIVQWVDWDSAGFAYADAQMDPRTGEILHQQIYFTSAWAKIGKTQADRLSKMLSAGHPAKKADYRVGLAGFNIQQLCDMDVNQGLEDQVSSILTKRLTPQQILKASQDLLREVVAHEVGHTLGLRHNFSGSLAANYKVSDRDKLFKQYLQTGSAPADLVTSSSVMDYQFPLESMLNGDQIAKALPAAEYDRKAIQTLYYATHFKPDEIPLFCTDFHTEHLPDCQRYDAGNSMAEWVQYQTQSLITNLPYTILYAYQNAKAPAFGMPPTPIELLSPDAQFMAGQILQLENAFLRAYASSTQFLSISRTFNFVNSTNEQEVRAKLEDYLLSETKRLGGLDRILLSFDQGFAAREYARFEAVLADPDNMKAVSFSAEEISIMMQTVRKYYQALQKELIKQEAAMLAGSSDDGKMQKGDLADSLAVYLAEQANEVLFATTKTPTIIQKISGTDIWLGSSQSAPLPIVTTYTLPQYAYEFDVRQKAASFLRSGRSTDLAWGFTQKVMLENKYSDMLVSAFPPIASMGPDTNAEIKKYVAAPPSLVSWLMDVLSIKAAL